MSESSSHASTVARSATSPLPSTLTRRMRADTRTSTSGCAAMKRCSRGMSQRAANDGAALTVSTPPLTCERSRSTACTRQSKPSRSFGSDARAASVSSSARL